VYHDKPGLKAQSLRRAGGTGILNNETPGARLGGKLLLLLFLYQFSPGKSFKQPFQPRHPFSDIGYIPSDIGHILSDVGYIFSDIVNFLF
jgi:hypothetical protein